MQEPGGKYSPSQQRHGAPEHKPQEDSISAVLTYFWMKEQKNIYIKWIVRRKRNHDLKTEETRNNAE